MTSNTVPIPLRALARWRVAMGLMGLGLVTTTAGLGWDFYVHEIERAAGESIFAAPHLLIFAGFAMTALGFLVGLAGLRPAAALRPA